MGRASQQEGRRLWLLPEIVGRNPAFPGRGSAKDLAEPPATAVLFPDFKHRPFLEAVGIFISFKTGYSHIQRVLWAIGIRDGGCDCFFLVLSHLAGYPWPKPAFASDVILAPSRVGDERFGFGRDEQGTAWHRNHPAFIGFI